MQLLEALAVLSRARSHDQIHGGFFFVLYNVPIQKLIGAVYDTICGLRCVMMFIWWVGGCYHCSVYLTYIVPAPRSSTSKYAKQPLCDTSFF